MELNFVFLRVGAVRRYCLRAKNEKRQKRHKFNIYAAFNIVKSLKTSGLALQAPTSRFYYLNILAWFRPLYQQSG